MNILVSTLFMASAVATLPTATLEKGGATFDFKALGEKRLAVGTLGENLVTHPDFSPESPTDPYRWRGGEYCFIHQPDVDRTSAFMAGMKAGVTWSIADGVATIVKSPKLLELAGGKPHYVLSTSGAWTKYVKLPHASGGRYRLTLKYKMKHAALGGKKGGGSVITTYVSDEPADQPLAEVPNGRLDYLSLVDSAADWTMAATDLKVAAGVVAVNLMIRIDGIGELAVKDVAFRRCAAREEEVYLHAEPVDSLDRSFHISEGHASVVAYQWQAKDPKAKYDLRKLAFTFETTGAFEILEKPKPGTPPTNPDYGWMNHGVIVKATGRAGDRGTLTATAWYDGRKISNTDVIELVCDAPIRAIRPKRYMTGFTVGGRYLPLRDEAARRAFMTSCVECGLSWAQCNEKDLAAAWRQAGAKIVASEQVGSNGYQLGPLQHRLNRPANERYVALCHLDLKAMGITGDKFEGDPMHRKREMDRAVCPVAVYEEMPYFKNEFLPWLKEALAGFDGDWANWEPFGFDGQGCFCDKCGRAFAKYLGVPEEEVMKDWPKCAIRTSTFEGRLAAKFPRFRSLEHAKLIRTLDKYVTAYTGPHSVGFMPGVGFDQMTSVGREVGADWYSPKDYQEGMKWMEPWGPYPHWKDDQPYTYLKTDVIRGWCAAKDIRETVDKIPADRRPKIQSYPHGMQGHSGITQPEWMRLNMDAFWANGWESTVIYFFPKGYDARWWRVFAEHTTRAAKYEDYVFDGTRVDAQNTLTPVKEYAQNIPIMGGRFPQFDNVPLLQHAAYDLKGRRIVIALNFWDFGDAFARLSARGLKAGDYRVVDEKGVLWAPNREKETWTAEELAVGIDIVVPALMTRVFEIVPSTSDVQPTPIAVFTPQDRAALYALRKPELVEAAAWDANYEAHNKVEKTAMPKGVYK